MFLDSLNETLINLNSRLEGNRSAKTFLAQLKTEIEKFRRNIPVLEVISCPRFSERHWQKMSDIVGFDLSRYENATVGEICDLDLNLYIAKLKPVAFIAEREGEISDQTNFITDFWAEVSEQKNHLNPPFQACFIMDITNFWGICVPTNLDNLIRSADEQISSIKVYREPDDKKSFINQNLEWVFTADIMRYCIEMISAPG